MPTEQTNVVINTPISRVWDFIADPFNMIALFPRDLNTTYGEIHVHPGGGYSYQTDYRYFRLHFSSKNRTTVFEPPSRLVIDTSGTFPLRTEWLLTAQGDRTHLNITLALEPPDSLLVQMGMPFVVQNTRNIIQDVADNAVQVLQPLADFRVL